MITITGAGLRYGFSGEDHLLDEGPIQDMIGRNYRDVRAAKRAACAIKSRQGRPSSTVPAWLEIEVCGERQTITV